MTTDSTSKSVPVWVFDLSSPPALRTKSNIPDPLGYPSHGSKKSVYKDTKGSKKTHTSEEMDKLKLKKAWEVAIAPVKSLPMTFIMMYMSGNTLQIFSIMMVVMAFKNPVMGLIGTSQAFERFETETNKSQILQAKLAYVAMQLVALALGMWKINGMGLLPTTRSDWLAWEALREPLEHALPAL